MNSPESTIDAIKFVLVLAGTIFSMISAIFTFGYIKFKRNKKYSNMYPLHIATEIRELMKDDIDFETALKIVEESNLNTVLLFLLISISYWFGFTVIFFTSLFN